MASQQDALPVWTEQGMIEPDVMGNTPVAGIVKLGENIPGGKTSTEIADKNFPTNAFNPKPIIPISILSLDDMQREKFKRLASLAIVDSGPTNLCLASSLALSPYLGEARLSKGGHPVYDFPIRYRPLKRGYKPETTMYVSDPIFELSIERSRRVRWSPDEVARFEAGLDFYGKEFFKVWQRTMGACRRELYDASHRGRSVETHVDHSA